MGKFIDLTGQRFGRLTVIKRTENKGKYLYGGRGITVCDEWKNDFKKFYEWAIINGYKDDLTIDRIDVNGNYCPENCRWVDMKTQQRNRRNNHLITYNNETHCLAEWAEILGIKYSILKDRINKSKWSIKKAFSKPIKKSITKHFEYKRNYTSYNCH